MKQYVWGLFVAVDQLVNKILNGNQDGTISACSYAFHKVDKFWSVMLKIIDFAFYPIDGKHHCKQAFNNDSETYVRGGYGRKTGIAIVVIPFCMLLSIFITWPFFFIRKGYNKLKSCYENRS